MRALVTPVVGACLAAVLVTGSAQALDYDFASIDVGDGGLSQLGRTAPSLNRTGVLAFTAAVYNPAADRTEQLVVQVGGGQTGSVFNLTEALGAGSPVGLSLNDDGAVAVHYVMATEAVIVRIGADGALVVLARADQAGTTPYVAFAPAIALNAGGQVAALVTNGDASSSIVRFDAAGAIEIARSAPGLANFSVPALNDAGVVAFRAVTAAGAAEIYTGTGGALTSEGTVDPCSPSGQAPVIGADGAVLTDCGAPLLVRVRGGVVTVVVSGGEDPAFGRLASPYSANDRGRVLFAAGPAGSAEIGLFTGSDPARDKVLRSGDTVFEYAVQDVRLGARALNDAGQVALLVQVGAGDTVRSHVVLATPRRIPQTIVFADPGSRTFGDPPFALTATSTSGLRVTFAATGGCSVLGDTLTLLGATPCTITASQAGDATYLPADDVSQTFSIGRGSQTITFDALVARTFGDAPVGVAATASSGLPVVFGAAGSCSLAGSFVTLVGAGSCIVTASQEGDANYEAAASVSRAFAVARAAQSLVFAPLPERTFGEPSFAVAAAASSGLPVGFSAAGSCSVAGGLVTLAGGGACTVTASQPGNADYEPAGDVAQTFGIGRAAQTIGFAPLAGRIFGEPPFTVTATASSGLSVTFAAAGPCAFAGGAVSLTGAGGCTVTASQAGDASYLPAQDVAQSFGIARASQTIEFGALANRGLGDPPFAVAASASSGLPVSFAAGGVCTITETVVTVTGAGACTITAWQAGNGNFEAAAAVERAFHVSGLLLVARFDAGGSDGFSWVPDAFRGTSQPAYASGALMPSGGFRGGALRVNLGGVDNNTVVGMSGGWRTTFELGAATKVTLYVRANLSQSPSYEPDEKSELLVSLDGALVTTATGDYVAQIVGDGNSGGVLTTGWRLHTLSLGTLGPGTHTLTIGAYNSRKTEVGETTTLLIDDVMVSEAASGARAAVDSLDFGRFKDNIRVLASFGDRTQGSASYMTAAGWLIGQLQAAGYTIQQHAYTYNGQPRTSIYVTKVGTLFPDQMYMVSAHLDGRGGGGAANDDASGCSLVLEAARALANLPTAVSVRFIFWNNEETGLNGSTAYHNQRVSQQGIENPPGSGLYPEPRWLGIIQHDQILFDHGLPPQPDQIPAADIDVEYQASSTYAAQSLQLASALRTGNQAYSTTYPAQVGSNMNHTDSVPFRNSTAAVSVRDNQRVAEIGNGSNPHWHQPTDVYASFSEDDFRLGFNAVQMTLGTVAELAGTTQP